MAFERLEGGRDILASSDLGCDDFEPEWPAVVWTSAISSICKYDRNNRCGLLCRDYRSGRVRDDDIDFAADELVRDLRDPLATSIRPAIFDRDGATFDPAEFAQPLHESSNPTCHGRGRTCAEEPNGRQRSEERRVGKEDGAR